jgi:hypothetical protein
MRALTPIELTGSAGSTGARLAALALLVTAFAAPPALAQSGGISAPGSGGAPAPDPAPTPAPPAPDAAPGADSGSVEAAPSPQTSPAPATPRDTTSSAPEASPPAAAASQSAPRAGRPHARTSGKRAAPNKARDERNARRQDRRSSVGRISPASVFRANLAPVGWVGGDIDAESPPVGLIAFALLTLVVASAALLTLTMRLCKSEGLTPPKPRDAQWLQRLVHTARFAQHGAGRRPAS